MFLKDKGILSIKTHKTKVIGVLLQCTAISCCAAASLTSGENRLQTLQSESFKLYILIY